MGQRGRKRNGVFRSLKGVLMQIKTIYMLKAEEGYVLKKGDTYTSAVLLREGETSEGWSEITQEEYEQIQEDQMQMAQTEE